MNNIFLNNDPLLYGSNTMPQMPSQQMNEAAFMNYMSQQGALAQRVDYIGELNRKLSELSTSEVLKMNENEEFARLNQEMQLVIQQELITLVSPKLNARPAVADNAKRQLEIINEVSKNIKETERENLNSLNDYLKNYSHLTFDEYQKIKNGASEQKKQ